MKLLLAMVFFSLVAQAQKPSFVCNEDLHRLIDKDFKNFGVLDGFNGISPVRGDLQVSGTVPYLEALTAVDQLLGENAELREYIKKLSKRSLSLDLVKRAEACIAVAEHNSPGNYYRPQREANIKKCEEEFSSDLSKIKTTDSKIKSYQLQRQKIQKQIDLLVSEQNKFAPSKFLQKMNLPYDKAIRYSYTAKSPRISASGSALELVDKYPNREVHATFLYNSGKLIGYELLETPAIATTPHRIVLVNENCKILRIDHNGLMQLPYKDFRVEDKYWEKGRQQKLDQRLEELRKGTATQ